MDAMRAVIGEILPLSVGIAVGPLAIIAAVLMLLSPKAKSTSLGFLTGWVLGITLAVVTFTLLSLALPKQGSGGPSASGVVKLILGASLLLLGSCNGELGPPKARRRRCRAGWRQSIQ